MHIKKFSLVMRCAEPEAKEAVAIYSFQARNKRELTFCKGDVLTLYEKLSNDWWEGITGDEREGLVPDKYIRLLNRLVSVHVINRLLCLL
jgi:hypothetical protein